MTELYIIMQILDRLLPYFWTNMLAHSNSWLPNFNTMFYFVTDSFSSTSYPDAVQGIGLYFWLVCDPVMYRLYTSE